MNPPKTIAKFIWHFIKRQPVAFSIVFVTAIVWAVNEVCFPYLIKHIINILNGFTGQHRQEIYSLLWLPLLVLILSWVVMEICMRMQGFTLLKAFPKFRANIRAEVFDYVKQHSHHYFSNHFAGNIAKKISELPTSCQTIMEILFFNIVSVSIAVVLALLVMGQTHLIFAIILLAWVCCHIGATLLFIRCGNKSWQIHSETVSVLSGKIVDCLTNIFNVRIFSRHKFENAYLKKYQDDEILKAEQAFWLIEILRIIQGIFGLSLVFGMVFTLVHGWIQGWVTLGDFSLVSMLTFTLMGMIWNLSHQLMVLVRESGTVDNALRLVNVPHGIADNRDAALLQASQGNIEFSQVTFGYQQNNPVFKQLNVCISAGEKVGLVGYSGSGKSTFVNLLLRSFDIQDGHIFIDHQDIAKVTQASLREQIAMIPQDPSLFHRSLLENIRYGRLDASDEEVIAAAKMAHCHEFIKEIPDGYAALVGERGIKLSGGQRQRIAIARALLKNAPILILDEATSSLDSVTERLIQESLRNLMQDRTTLVIAHRLSTLADMDRILVFHHGQIVEQGTQESLLSQKGIFASLWHMQVNGFLPEEG